MTEILSAWTARDEAIHQTKPHVVQTLTARRGDDVRHASRGRRGPGRVGGCDLYPEHVLLIWMREHVLAYTAHGGAQCGKVLVSSFMVIYLGQYVSNLRACVVWVEGGRVTVVLRFII